MAISNVPDHLTPENWRFRNNNQGPVSQRILSVLQNPSETIDEPKGSDLNNIKPGDVIISNSLKERLVTRVVKVEDDKIEIVYDATQTIDMFGIQNRFNKLDGEPLTEEKIVKDVQVGDEMSYVDPKLEKALELGHAQFDDPRIKVRLEFKSVTNGQLDYIVISSQGRHEVITNTNDGSWMRKIMKAPEAA